MKRDIVIKYLVEEQMEKAGKSQADLARLTGMQQPNINAIIQNKSRPTLPTLKKIAIALNCFVKDLFEEQEIIEESQNINPKNSQNEV